MKRIIILTLLFLILAIGVTQFNGVVQIFNPHDPNYIKYNNAKNEFTKGNYETAISMIDFLPANSVAGLTDFRSTIINTWKLDVQKKVQSLFKQKKYKRASEILKPILKIQKDDPILLKLQKTSIEFSKVAEYSGSVEHIFFHPLMTYSKVKNNMKSGFDDWFITIDEYKRTLEQFYKKGYALIDIHSIYGVYKNGNVYSKTFNFPINKKPLVFSVDDYNFLKYMKENGCAEGLGIVNGKVLSYETDLKGIKTYSDDKEITPILDKFVDEHPDFSYGGAKGIIALEGYEGALGFPTKEISSSNYKKVLVEAQLVAKTLKNNGWLFASHSYGHNKPSNLSVSKFQRDILKWRNEVSKVVGKTDIYIYPFGEFILQRDLKFKALLKEGFRIFCEVYAIRPDLEFRTTNIRMSRRPIDGYSIKRNRYSDIINESNIPSKVRPWYNKFKDKNYNY